MQPFNLEELIKFIKECKKDTVTVVIDNKEMKGYELITFGNSDFKYKADYYKRAYNHDLTLKANSDIKIVDWDCR